MDKLRTYSHGQSIIAPKQQPMNKVFTPTTARALMTVHAGPFYNSHPPVVMLVHGNTRNHEESDLEVTCKMVAQNQTYGLLAAAEEENQLGLHWPFKVDFGSALRAVSSMYGRWRSWESNSTKSPRTATTSLQVVCKVCLL